jgi:hypothetical protein
MDHAWVKPDEDFSQYSRIGLIPCYVPFKKNWRTSHPDIRKSDMDEARAWLTAEFRKTFTEIIVNNGYSIATAPAKDVLIIRPSLVDLEIGTPDTQSDVKSTTFTTSTGSVNLYLELFDSESSEILARAVERRPVDPTGDVEVPSFSTDSDDARRLLKQWGEILISELNATLGKADD